MVAESEEDAHGYYKDATAWKLKELNMLITYHGNEHPRTKETFDQISTLAIGQAAEEELRRAQELMERMKNE